jgi:hypothetical protein
MINADHLNENKVCIDGRWVVARPLPFYGLYGLWMKIKDAWKVVKGEADAVKFYKQ